MLCLAVSLCLLLTDQSDNQPIPTHEVVNNAQNNVEPHQPMQWFDAVSYTHLTLPTNREV